MANGDYWNRGRREGVQRSTAMDTLETVLNLGTNIAGRVQDNRDRRNVFYSRWITEATEGLESNYSNSDLNLMESRISDFEEKHKDKFTLESREMLDLRKSKIEQHKMVYKALKGKMGNELHALALNTMDN